MKFTPILGQDLSGSVAGVTASRNASGAYFRGRTIPSDKFTAASREARECMRNVAPDYAALSSVDKASWATYASGISFTPPIGSTYTLTAQQMYVRSALSVKCCDERQPGLNLSLPDTAPSVSTLPVFSVPPTIVFVTVSTQIIQIAFDDTDFWANEDGAYMSIRVSPPQGAGVSSFGGPFAFGLCLPGSSAVPPFSPFSLQVPFPVKVGELVFAEVRNFRADGGLSLPVIIGPEVVVA